MEGDLSCLGVVMWDSNLGTIMDVREVRWRYSVRGLQKGDGNQIIFCSQVLPFALMSATLSWWYRGEYMLRFAEKDISANDDGCAHLARRQGQHELLLWRCSAGPKHFHSPCTLRRVRDTPSEVRLRTAHLALSALNGRIGFGSRGEHILQPFKRWHSKYTSPMR